MKTYLYHAISSNFQGETIYPLNELKRIYPKVYAEKVKSYSWRPEVMEQPVYPLNCLWNDCIFLMAAPPQEVKHQLRQLNPKARFPSRFWKIDPHLLEPEKTAIYNFAHAERPHPPEDFLPYDPDNLAEYAVIPERTIEYWRAQIEQQNLRVLLYLYIPHIMYRGQIDTHDIEIIEVES